MIHTYPFDAKTAQKKTEEFIDIINKPKSELIFIFDKIKSATHEGKFEVTMPKILDYDSDKLKKLGYLVVNVFNANEKSGWRGWLLGEMEEPVTCISWE